MNEMSHEVETVYQVIDGLPTSKLPPAAVTMWREEGKCSKGHDLTGSSTKVYCPTCKLWWPR